MTISKERREWYQSQGLPLPGRPKKRTRKDSKLVRAILSEETYRWWLSLESEARGEIIELAHKKLGK